MTTAHRLFLDKVKHDKVVLKFELQQSNRQNEQNPEFLLEEQENHIIG